MQFIKSNLTYFFLSIVLIGSLVHSYIQYSKSTIDGDVSRIVVSAPPYDKVLKDPLGLSALKGEEYGATNRYTAHLIMSEYFLNIPLFLQNFVSPVQSVFLSIYLMKFLTHLLLLFLISYYVSAWNNFSWKSIIIAAVLINPLFYTGSSSIKEYMAIIDPAITYVMFYALPFCALLLFLLPFYKYLFTGKLSSSPLFIISWIVFAGFLVFFGPLTAPMLIVAITVIFGYIFIKGFLSDYKINTAFNAVFKMRRSVLILFIITLLFSFYSMYIGTKNIENIYVEQVSLTERFIKLANGIVDAFLKPKSGLLFVVLLCIINLTVTYKYYKENYKNQLKITLLLIVFSVLYTLLLPLGGYRFYRPLIVRRDTLFPVLIIIYYIWGTTSIVLLKHLPKTKTTIFCICATVLFVFFEVKNKKNASNICQQESMIILSESKSNVVKLERNCILGLWSFNTEKEGSKDVAKLLKHWNITPGREVLFYYDEEK
ncbi:hypothetical protein GCM10007424_04960 [Flavobacterium suaedae]|uniref:Glycosyltransferase RgtA/B/C/D-like domain-containing protein n=1 Tax=Flavobacterium suaedae TaxID=1767027 RepID=A0ABQ1JJE6_9FLAO|nr:hypothetical protein [Flavobacterium suaedae]GGB67990.1 hypothetical protein GCM10007424_04960 [Flavobacterium suaedae]